MKLKDVFLALKQTLDGQSAPSSKEDGAVFEALFAKAVPNYDAERFYVSHMKKVCDWYNDLAANASLDFEEEEEK